jgi:hypothetical protein
MSRYIDAEYCEDFFDRWESRVKDADPVTIDVVQNTRTLLRDAPSIDIEQKRGEWIVHSNGKMCDCSVCNESYDRTFEYVDEWNFCPNCGARMKGADDE